MTDPKYRQLSLMAIAYFLLQLQFWFPIWVIFLLDRDLTLEQIVIADIIYWIAIVILEFPMGVIGDRIGRRNTFFSGAFLGGIAYYLMLQINDFPSLILSWLIWGMYIATISGTDNAYIYELIVEIGLLNRAKYIFGYFAALKNLALLLSTLTAGYLYVLNNDYPIILNTIAAVLSGLTILLLPKVEVQVIHHPVSQVKQIFNTLKSKLSFRFILLLMAVIYTYIYAATLLFQPLLQILDLPVSQFGLVFASFPIFAILGGLFAGKIADYLGIRIHIILNMIMIISSMLIIGLVPGIFSIIGIFLVYFSYNLIQPVLLEIVNNGVDNHLRASTLSLANLISSLGLMIARPGIVLLSNIFSIQLSYFIWGVIGISVCCLVLIWGILKEQNIFDDFTA